MTRYAACFLGALLLFCWPACGYAEPPKVALVIGNGSYKSAPLKNPANDAKDIAAALRELGFDVIEKIDVTQREMNRAITQFGAKLATDSVAVFYFAGHGIQVKGKNFLIPVDAQIESESSVRSETVDVDAVLDQLSASALNVVILDACRNNPFERRFRSIGGGLAQMDAPKGTLIAYATSPGKVALDGDGRNGLYTQELLKVIRMPGLEVEKAFKRVRANVARATNDNQIPWEASSLTGDFSFGGTAGAMAAVAPPPAPVQTSAPPVERARSFGTVQLQVGEQLDKVSIYPMQVCNYSRPLSSLLDESVRRLASGRSPGIEFVGDTSDAVLSIHPLKANLAKTAGQDSDYVNTLRLIVESKLSIRGQVVMTKTYEERSTSKYASCCTCSAWDDEIDSELKKVTDGLVGRLLDDLSGMRGR